MAWYKYTQFVVQFNDNNPHGPYDQLHSPGTTPPHSGIYRCQGCGREIVAEQSRQFPPQNHHQHTSAQGVIAWRLIAAADHNPK
jgi:hypothetical protein